MDLNGPKRTQFAVLHKVKVTQSEMFVNLQLEIFPQIDLNSTKSCAKTWGKRVKYHDMAIKPIMTIRSLSPFRSISVNVLPSL